MKKTTLKHKSKDSHNSGTKIATICLIAGLSQQPFSVKATLPAQSSFRFVENIEDFRIHIQHHVDNVVKLGMHLYHSNPSYFRGVDPVTLEKFLKLHDKSKMMSPEELRSDGHWQRRSFTEMLFDYYGHNYHTLTDVEEMKLGAIIESLNQLDSEIAKNFFREHSLLDTEGGLTKTAELILMIEKISDVVERDMSPVTPEELGRKTKNAIEKYLNASERFFAIFLKKKYNSVVNQKHPLLIPKTCVMIFD